MRDDEGFGDRTERELCVSLSEPSLPEPSDNSEPDITPEWYATLRPMEGFSFNLREMRLEDSAEEMTKPTFR